MRANKMSNNLRVLLTINMQPARPLHITLKSYTEIFIVW
jgi:hypothetical protein